MPLSKSIFNKDGVFYNPTAIENEIRNLEKAKERQKIEIQALIKHNLNLQHKQKEIEEKASAGKNKSLKRKSSDYGNYLEMEQNNKNEEENTYNSNSKTFSNFNFNNFKITKKSSYNLEDENGYGSDYFNDPNNTSIKKQRNYLELKKKVDEYHDLQEKEFWEEKSKAEKKMQLIKDKEKERLEQLEKKRIEKIKVNESLRMLHRFRLENEMQKNHERAKKSTEKMDERLIKSEIKRQQLEELRNLGFKKKGEEALKKQEEIQKFFQREREKEEIRNIQLDKKLLEYETQKKAMDKLRIEEIKQRMDELKIKERKTVEAREIKEKFDDEKRDNVVVKINEVYYKFKLHKEQKEKDHMLKNELNTLKRSETLMKIKRIENIKEYEMSRLREIIDDKYSRSQSFQERRSLIFDNKRLISIDTSNKRELIKSKFEKLAKEPIIEETYKQLFPEDSQFLEKIQTFKESLMNKSSQLSSNSHENLVSEKKLSSNTKQITSGIQLNELKLSKVFDRTKLNISVTDSKSFKNKSIYLKTPSRISRKNSNINNKDIENLDKEERTVNLIVSNRISEKSFDNENQNEKIKKYENKDNFSNSTNNLKNELEKNKLFRKINKKIKNKSKKKDEKLNNKFSNEENKDEFQDFNSNNFSPIKDRNDNFINNNINLSSIIDDKRDDINNDFCSEKFEADPKQINNNFFKFTTNNPKFLLNINYKPKKIQNVNVFNSSNEINSNNNLSLLNPKINIKINDTAEKLANNIEFLISKKRNSDCIPLNYNLRKNINININNNITNFCSMINFPVNIDEGVKLRKNTPEGDIQQKLSAYRTKLTSEVIKFLNEEKIRENERQNVYDNLKDNQEKFNLEQEISRRRLETSEKISKMNQDIDKKIKEYEYNLRAKL